MEKLQVTSMSSRGQIVIPQEIRKNLGLQEGEKFIVIAEDDTVLLKKLTVPSFKGFDKLLKRTQAFARKKGLAKGDLEAAVKRTRA